MNKKRNLPYIIIISVMLTLALIFSLMTKMSYIDDTDVNEQIANGGDKVLNILDSEHYVDSYFNNKITNIEELKNLSTLIVRVRPTTERVNYSGSILTKVEVLSYINDDPEEPEKYIYVYEPNNFINNHTYVSTGGYNLMKINKEYIIFLEGLKVNENYEYQENEIKAYKPISTLYSKYPVEDQTENIVIDFERLNNELISYKQVEDYSILTLDKAVLNKYEQLLNEVVHEYLF